jgi:hypothetical protein
MQIAILILLVLNFVITFLTLSAVGNSLTTLRADIAEGFSHQVWQHRVSRKAILEVLNDRVLPLLGYKEPPTIEQQLENMIAQMQARTKEKMQA